MNVKIEDAVLRDQIDRYNQRLREFEERQRSYRGMPTHAERGGGGGAAGNGNGNNGAGNGNTHGQSLEVRTFDLDFILRNLNWRTSSSKIRN